MGNSKFNVGGYSEGHQWIELESFDSRQEAEGYRKGFQDAIRHQELETANLDFLEIKATESVETPKIE